LESSSDTTETGAVGWLAGPYVAFEVAKDVIVQGRFNWGKSDRELLFAGVRDEFEGTRWMAGASISGTWTQGQWTMRPGATVVHMEDVTESYTDIVGNVMPEVHYSAGQAAVGPQLSYRWMPSDSVMVTPRIGANILWTFTENLDIAGGNSIDGEPSGPGGLRGNVDFGLSVAWMSGTSIDLSGTYDGIGVSDFESKTGRAMLNVPLN
jgi:outer membrane autotransporter protein